LVGMTLTDADANPAGSEAADQVSEEWRRERGKTSSGCPGLWQWLQPTGDNR